MIYKKQWWYALKKCVTTDKSYLLSLSKSAKYKMIPKNQFIHPSPVSKFPSHEILFGIYCPLNIWEGKVTFAE